jgi:hypothetical protein
MFSRLRQDCLHQTIKCRSMAPGVGKTEAPATGLSKLNSMAFRLAAGTVRSMVGFAGRVTHVRRKTRFRPLVKLYRTGFPPAGLLRKVSDLYSTFHPPFPSLLGAITSTEAPLSPGLSWSRTKFESPVVPLCLLRSGCADSLFVGAITPRSDNPKTRFGKSETA